MSGFKNKLFPIILFLLCTFPLAGDEFFNLWTGEWELTLEIRGTVDGSRQKWKPFSWNAAGEIEEYFAKDYPHKVTVPDPLMIYPPGGEPVFHWLKKDFFLPEHLKGKPLAFLMRAGCVDQTFINGTEIGRTGHFSPHFFPDWNRIRSYSVPGGLLNREGKNTIYLRIQQGEIKSCYLGIKEDIEKKASIDNFFRMAINGIFALLIFSIGIYHMMIYILRPKDKENLWYSLSCFFMALAMSFHYITIIPFFDYTAFNYFGFWLFAYLFEIMALLAVMNFFSECLYEKKRGMFHNRLYIAIHIMQLMAFLFMLGVGENSFEHWLSVLETLILIPLFYSFWLLVRGVMKKNPLAKTFLLGFIPGILFLSYDIIDANILSNIFPGFKSPPFFLAALGIPFFMIVVALTLSRQFVRDRNALEALNLTLEDKVIQRTGELKAAQDQLVQKAYKAGMADIAVGVVHSIGNVLTSIMVSGESISSTLKKSSLGKFKKAVNLLQKNRHRIVDFLTIDSKGKALLNYFVVLEKSFTNEHSQLENEISQIIDKIRAINNIIVKQNEYTGYDGFIEEIDLEVILQDGIAIMKEELHDVKIALTTNIRDSDKLIIKGEKTKLIFILFNLLKNAKEAIETAAPGDPRILVTAGKDQDENIFFSVSDNGPGIEKKMLAEIFQQGVTTKEARNGLGLHCVCKGYEWYDPG